MTKYFFQFPKIEYNLSKSKCKHKEVTDIFRRVKEVRLVDNVSLFDKYDVAEVKNLKMYHTNI